MGFLYFDDSKHPNRGFVLGAWIYAPKRLDVLLSKALVTHGIRLGEGEFKSSTLMQSNPNLAKLRNELTHIISMHCHIGVAITADEKELGQASLLLLAKMLRHENLANCNHSIFFDQGIFSSASRGLNEANKVDRFENCEFFFEQDSKFVYGIQLADLTAHTCATMLAESLGQISKTVKAGENSGYDPDTDIEIGFELWAPIRWNFLSEPPPHPDNWTNEELQPISNVEPFGLYVSEQAPQKLKEAALARFGKMYLGCIH